MSQRCQFNLRALMTVTTIAAVLAWLVLHAPPLLLGCLIGFVVAPMIVVFFKAHGLAVAVPLAGAGLALGVQFQLRGHWSALADPLGPTILAAIWLAGFVVALSLLLPLCAVVLLLQRPRRRVANSADAATLRVANVSTTRCQFSLRTLLFLTTEMAVLAVLCRFGAMSDAFALASLVGCWSYLAWDRKR